MKRETLLWIAGGALLAAALVWHAWHSAFDHDEIQHLHAAWLVGQGAIPFRDFLEQHHPTFWYLLAPLAQAFASPRLIVFTARLADLGVLAAFVTFFVAAARMLFPGSPARWPALMLVASFTFTRNVMEVRPDPLMALFLLAGLFFWLRFLGEENRGRAILAGLLFGLALVVLQKAAAPLGLVVAASVVVVVLRRRSARRGTEGLALLLAGAAIPLAGLFLLMRYAGLGEEFFFWNYPFNRFLYLHAPDDARFSLAKTVGEGFLRNPALWLAGVAGFALLARELWRRRTARDASWERRFVILVVAAGYLLSLAASRMPFDHYLIAWLPLLALASVAAFEWLGRRGWGAAYRVAAVLMTAELVVILLAYPSSAPQRAVQDAVLAGTRPGEAVVVSPPHHPIVRPDGTYFWYNGAMIGTAYADFCAAGNCDNSAIAQDDAIWEHTKPAFVYLDPEWKKFWPYRWDERKAAYEPTAIPGLLKRRP